MPAKLFFLSLLILRGVVSFGQSDIDSLGSLLEISSDSAKVEIYLSLVNALNSSDPEQALEYALLGEKLASDLGSLALMGKIINGKGVAYYYLNELNLSDEAYFEALNLFDSAGSLNGKARVLNNIGWNYKVREMNELAIDYFNQGLIILKETGDPDLLQGILNNLGTIYRNQGHFKKALDIYKESLELNRSIGNRKWEAYNLNNIGMVFMDSGQFEMAKRYLHHARNMNFENGYLQEYTRNILNLGSLNIRMQEYDSADYYLELANSVIEDHNFKREKIDYYGNKRDLYAGLNDYREALEFEKRYNALNAELNQIAWNEKVTELQTKYVLAQKDRALEASQRKLNLQQFVILSGTASFLFLLILLFLVLRMYKTKNQWAKNVEKLNEEIKEKNETLKSMNEEIQQINNNLEQTIKDRTEKILHQNEKLIKYAFINSHEIRGPLARVLGLLYLIGLENSKMKEDVSFRMLYEATSELDTVVKQASDLLESEDFFHEEG
jgi:tetratricopeptide (TPR) repeat protein